MLFQQIQQRSLQQRPVQARRSIYVRAYQPPSSATALTELDLLSRYSQVVPDAAPAGNSQYRPKAATVSCHVLRDIVASESLGLKPYENAILTALNYDRCRELPPDAAAQCKLDKAIVNVGALYAQEVEGRVCTQVDPRLYHSTEKMVAKVEQLLELYTESKVPANKLIFRLPGTWAGIQAAKQLEAKGITTQVFLVFSMIQAVACAQAGVSVIQPSVGRIRECFIKYPNMIRDPYGPRQDAGFITSADPGITVLQQIYTYVKKYHPKTQIMVSGIRTKDDALALSGVDFMVLPAKLMSELAATPTTAGYNDGLRAAESVDEGTAAALSVNAAEAANIDKMGPVTEQMFNEGLGMAAEQLLKEGLQAQAADAERILPYFEKSTSATSNL